MSTLVKSALVALAVALSACSGSERDNDSVRETERPMAADNTGNNARDRANDLPTPMEQGNSESDLAITQTIRQALMADESLSMAAKNVKVITLEGHVALRGPVDTATEKATINRIAGQTAGVTRVVDLLEVKPSGH